MENWRESWRNYQAMLSSERKLEKKEGPVISKDTWSFRGENDLIQSDDSSDLDSISSLDEGLPHKRRNIAERKTENLSNAVQSQELNKDGEVIYNLLKLPSTQERQS